MNRMILVSAAVITLISASGCTSGRIHEKSYLRAAAVSDNGQLAFAFFNEDDTIVGTGDDMDAANDAAVEGASVENPEDEIIPIDNPLIDGLGFGASATPKPAPSNQDYDLDDIFKMLGN